ncbi:MAG: adenylate/guanylate cyclase domain-containing protein [Planctomycetota bacterium]
MSLKEATEQIRLGKFDDARQSLRHWIATTDAELTIEAKLLLSKLCIFGGSQFFDEAQYCLASIKPNVISADSSQLLVALNLRALLERSRGKRKLAFELLSKNPVLEQTEPSEAKSQCKHYLGLLTNELGDVEAAQNHLFVAYEIADQIKFIEGKAEICDTIAGLLLKLGKTKTALAFAEKSLQAKLNLNDRYGTAITYGTIGRIQLSLANDRAAEKAFLSDLEIARELNDENGIAIMLNSLGDISRRSGDIKSALNFFDESLATNDSNFNKIYANIGRCWTHLSCDEIDEARDCLTVANSHESELNAFPELMVILQGLGAVIEGRDGTPGAIQRLEEAISKLENLSLGLDSIPFRYELRDFYWRENRTSDAVQVMSDALEVMTEIGSQQGIDAVEEWLRKVDRPRLTRVAIERHFPNSVVDQILSGDLNLPQPSKQKITILFCDLRGFTTLSEKQDPEYVVDLLNEWFSEATRAIQKHQGIVDKFIGDAVMALFGVNSPNDNAATNAIQAAIGMRSALAAMNQRNAVLGITKLKIGIGIASGEAVVGFMGSHLRHAYTAIGDPVNVAARLESETRNFENCDMIIDQSTYQQNLDREIKTKSLGEVRLKGKSTPVKTYQVFE